MANTFATAINCMDGRVQEPVAAYMRTKFGVDYVDMITEPGPNKVLAMQSDFMRLSTMKECFLISVNHHHSKVVAVVGHYDCAGNPADEDTQCEHIRKGIRTVRGWEPNVQVIGLWVDAAWKVHEVE